MSVRVSLALKTENPNSTSRCSYLTRSEETGPAEDLGIMCGSVTFCSWCQVVLRYPALMVAR